MRGNYQNGGWEKLADVCGCYLGACIIAAFGGRWVRHPDGLAVEVAANVVAVPIAKTGKHFANGWEGGDSAVGLFNSTPAVVKRSQAS